MSESKERVKMDFNNYKTRALQETIIKLPNDISTNAPRTVIHFFATL